MMDRSRWLNAMAGGLLFAASPARAEDGYRLWLRYDRVEQPLRVDDAKHATELVIRDGKPAASVAAEELRRGLSGLLGSAPAISSQVDRDGAIVLERSKAAKLGDGGFQIRSTNVRGHHATIISADGDVGLLYGAFTLLHRIQMHERIDHLKVRDRPRLPLRMLDHWDNLDGSIERGYSGKSIWDWASLPSRIDPRYIDYARANASIGINATVLNNVNADPKILTREYLTKVAPLASTFRPYGIRVYLSVRFSSPIEVGGLKTADPLDPEVRAWWRAKADEIYSLIPDFGGFLIKANSEGQPGPQDYHRTHAEGANVIADALRPHGGTVLWRAFVYGAPGEDRAMQAYDEFRPLDGKFRDNVILQVKNGPIDFQPREPFHPLFGQMPHARLALEAQITREYLGQSTGVAFLGPMWTEVLNADTCSPRCGTPVSATVVAMAGVSNVGSDRNWTGTNFDQANWYAFGRLAWNPRLTAQEIAREWTHLTWTNRPRAAEPIVAVMMGSRETTVDFMTPLGLAHQMATDYHYGPAPWVCDLKPVWDPCYYNKADASGIGFDRVSAAKTKTLPEIAVNQYAPTVAARFANLATIPDKYLLWFHRLPWDYRMRSGGTLWDELVHHYDRGVSEVVRMDRSWASARPYVDAERWGAVDDDLHREQSEAQWWRDASIAYFQSKSNLPLPAGSPAPAHSLSYYEALRPPGLPGQRP